MNKKWLFILILSGCNHVEDSELNAIVGNWQLVEQLIDPGDGSGEFQAVTSNKTIQFDNEGRFSSNGSLCFPDIASDLSSTGVYDPATSTLHPDDCGSNDSRERQFELVDGELIIYFLCIEACKQKYRRV